MEHFYFISDVGKTSLPTKLQLKDHFEKTGEKIILVLDSSVCIDIVKLVNWKEKAKSDKLKIFNLSEYIQKHNIEFLSIFALVESCYDRENLIIQSDKYYDFHNRITFAFNYPIKKFKQLKFNFELDFYTEKPSKIKSEVVKSVIDTRINPYYAGLLKIAEIAQDGISQKRSEKNIEQFIDWMENELGCFLGFEYTLALQIFGGNSKFGSMLKIGAKKDIALKAIWGTAWDLFHAKMSINKELISELIDKKVYPIFVTKDIDLFNLMSPYVNSYARRNFTKVMITENNEYPPHYSDEFMEKLNAKMTELIIKRFGKDAEIDNDKVKKLIISLENSIK